MSLALQIENILKEKLQPTHLEVVNDSHRHKGHAGDDGSGESHFSLFVVSDHFRDLNRIERHRMIYEVLDQALENMPHAIAIKAYSPDDHFL